MLQQTELVSPHITHNEADRRAIVIGELQITVNTIRSMINQTQGGLSLEDLLGASRQLEPLENPLNNHIIPASDDLTLVRIVHGGQIHPTDELILHEVTPNLNSNPSSEETQILLALRNYRKCVLNLELMGLDTSDLSILMELQGNMNIMGNPSEDLLKAIEKHTVINPNDSLIDVLNLDRDLTLLVEEALIEEAAA